MKRVFPALTAALALLGLSGVAEADVFNLGPGLTNLETVTVGDSGNAADTRYASPGYGSVSYTYGIGKYEVTTAQYADFLNNKAKSDPYGLYNTRMAGDTLYLGCHIQRGGDGGGYIYSVADDWANRPVNYVSFWDACRFANWLGNGQGNGDTETGTYTLNGYNGDDGHAIQRNVRWTWSVASENEWYKTAYYKGGGTNAGYWDYATQSDTPPSNEGSDGYTDPGNHANYNDSGYTIGSPYYRTNAGEFENSGSAYCTFDQSGNVSEWNETDKSIVSTGGYYVYRGVRGGAYRDVSAEVFLRALYLGKASPLYESDKVGFRVSAAVPEPSSIVVVAAGLVSLLGTRRRRA